MLKYDKKEPKNFLSAVYQDGKVRIRDKFFPAGQFCVDLLNGFHENEVAPRVIVARANNWEVLEQLKMGFLDEQLYVKAGKTLEYVLNWLPKLKPFDLMNIESEQQRIADLFTEENAERLREFFRERAIVGTMDDGFIAADVIPHKYNKKFCESASALYEEVLSVFSFYDRLGDDLNFSFTKLKFFVSLEDDAERYDEAHLLPIAQNVFNTVSIETVSEYIQVRNTSRSTSVSLARRISFDSFLSFILTDFYEGLHYGHYPRKCDICGKYFLMTSARLTRYCDGFAPDLYRGKRITCRNLAAQLGQRETAEDDPVKVKYTSRCSAIRSEKSRGTITEEFAEAAKRLAKEHKLRALSDHDYAQKQYNIDMSRELLYADTDRMLKAASVKPGPVMI